MKSRLAYSLLAAATLAAAGCSGGGGDSAAGVTPPPPPVATTTPFTPFVKEQLTLTADTTEPVSVNEQDWTFDEEETAYDDVLDDES